MVRPALRTAMSGKLSTRNLYAARRHAGEGRDRRASAGKSWPQEPRCVTLRVSGEAAAAAVPGASRARWLGRGRQDGVRHFAARNAEGQHPATRARLLRIMVPPVARARQWLHGSMAPSPMPRIPTSGNSPILGSASLKTGRRSCRPRLILSSGPSTLPVALPLFRAHQRLSSIMMASIVFRASRVAPHRTLAPRWLAPAKTFVHRPPSLRDAA